MTDRAASIDKCKALLFEGLQVAGVASVGVAYVPLCEKSERDQPRYHQHRRHYSRKIRHARYASSSMRMPSTPFQWYPPGFHGAVIGCVCPRLSVARESIRQLPGFALFQTYRQSRHAYSERSSPRSASCHCLPASRETSTCTTSPSPESATPSTCTVPTRTFAPSNGRAMIDFTGISVTGVIWAGRIAAPGLTEIMGIRYV